MGLSKNRGQKTYKQRSLKWQKNGYRYGRRLRAEPLEDRRLLAATFEIVNLAGTGALVVDHDSITSDDRGGIAISNTHVFYTGDGGTGRFNNVNLSGGTNVGATFDSLTSNLLNGKVYSLGVNSTTPHPGSTGTITHLLEHNGSTGSLLGTSIALSTPISVVSGSGIFAGADRILIHNTSAVYEIDLTPGSIGTVTNLGALATPSHMGAENWAYWGVAEHFGGEDYISYVRDFTTISRTRVSDGFTSTVATFPGGLSDMAAFTVSLAQDRWFFHYEGSTSTFGGTAETIGFADAEFNTTIDIENVGPDPRSTSIDSIYVTFDRAINASTFDYNDITLILDSGSNLITPSVTVNQLSSTDFVITGLSSLTMADGQYELRVDGNSITDSTSSILGGRGAENWLMDSTLVPLDAARRPRGSLIYDGTEMRSVLQAPGDIQALTVDIDPGQTITVLVEPNPNLQATIAVTDPANVVVGSTAAASPGQKVLLQTVPVTVGGTYTVTIGTAAGTTGDFNVKVVLNAALESEAHDGATNDTLVTAQDIDTSFIGLAGAGERGAVIGEGGKALYGVSRVDTRLYVIDPATGQTITSLPLTLPGGTVFGFNRGLALDPISGLLYGLLQTTNALDDLVVVDPNTGVVTSIGAMSVSGRRFGEIAFDAAGNLYGITGGSGSNPSTLFRIDKTNPGIQTALHTFSTIGAGGVALNTDDGLLYRFNSGSFESIDVSTPVPTITSLSFSGAVPFRTQGMVYLGGDRFLMVGDNDDFYTIDTSGVGTLVSLTTNNALLHGLAAVGSDDTDVYAFTLDNGEVVSLALTEQLLRNLNHSLELLDSSGSIIAIANEATNVNQLISDFAAPGAGTYFARVTREVTSALGYSLVVTRSASFDTEPNSSLEDAQPLDATGVALGHLSGHLEHDLYAVDGAQGPSTLYSLDPTTGEILDTIGPIGFNNVKGLDVDPTTGILYGYADNIGLLEIDPETGAGTLIGGGQQYTNISFDSNGVLYGSSPTHLNPGIWTIDLSTGVGTKVLNFFDRHRYAVAVDVNDQLWLRDDNSLYTIDLGASTVTFSSNITGFAGGNFFRAGEFEPTTGLFYDVTLINGISGPSTLHSIDSETGIATPLGTANIGINALAFATSETSGDYYSVSVSIGEQIDLRTYTPADGPGEFVNELDPVIELYDPSGALVATDDNSAADGRNATIQHVAASGGTYTIRVTSAAGAGEYVLVVNPNQPPMIQVDSAAVSTIEGAVVTNTGTFSDPQGNATVTITASVGTVTQNNGAGTWSWSYSTSDGPDQSGTVTITATDSDGAESTTTFGLTVNNVAPVVTLTGVASADEGQTKSYTFTTNDPGDDTFTVLGITAGPDATISNQVFDANTGTGSFDVTFHDGPNTTAVSVQVEDSDGADSNLSSIDVLVSNVAPVVTLTGVASADEGQTKSYTFTTSDPGDDTFTVLGITAGPDATISNQVFDASTGTGSFDVTFHDGPNTTAVSVQVEDSDGADSNLSSIDVLVSNVAPVITDITNTSPDCGMVAEGESVDVSGTFTDDGTLDTHTAIIEWGDGSDSPAIIIEPGAFGTFSGSHVYTDGGIYTVTVTLMDDDTGVVTATTTTVIVGVGIVDDVLYVIGTENDDHVTINQQGNGTLKVHADFLPSGNFKTFNLAAIDSIMADLCHGDDHLTIAGNVTLPAILKGGEGNDKLNSGAGPTILLGGTGDDQLNAGGARSLLIGGTGRDKLNGGNQDDILIGGDFEIAIDNDLDDDANLLAALAAWSTNGTYSARVTAVLGLLNDIDDGAKDDLNGTSGRDLYFSGVGDDLKAKLTGGDAESVV
jgi:predicted RNA methylase